MDENTVKKLGGVVTKLVVNYSRKVSDGDYGSEGASFGMEVDVPAGANVEQLTDAVYAYLRMASNRNLAPALKERIEGKTAAAAANDELQALEARIHEDFAQRWVEVNEAARDAAVEVGKAAAVAFGASPTPAREEDPEQGHTRVARFTLVAKPDGKFQLEMYPRIHDEPGKYPELKFTSNREDMWAMIGPEWDDAWGLPPIDKAVDWLADWRLGREKTGPKAKPGSRYKDLVAIHAAE